MKLLLSVLLLSASANAVSFPTFSALWNRNREGSRNDGRPEWNWNSGKRSDGREEFDYSRGTGGGREEFRYDDKPNTNPNGGCPAVWTTISKELTGLFLSGGMCNDNARAAI